MLSTFYRKYRNFIKSNRRRKVECSSSRWPCAGQSFGLFQTCKRGRFDVVSSSVTKRKRGSWKFVGDSAKFLYHYRVGVFLLLGSLLSQSSGGSFSKRKIKTFGVFPREFFCLPKLYPSDCFGSLYDFLFFFYNFPQPCKLHCIFPLALIRFCILWKDILSLLILIINRNNLVCF